MSNECEILVKTVKSAENNADILTMKRIMLVFVLGFSLIALCSAQARVGEVNRGIFYQEGVASWYGREFNGRTTASGEIFNDSQFTAAHPILPFGTMLRVTNQYNNRTVTVRVNDRGPFVAARILDLSRAAAEHLDMIGSGTALVKIESIYEVSLPSQPGQAVQARPASAEPYSNTEVVSGQAPGLSQPQAADRVDAPQLLMEMNGVRFKPAIPEIPTGKNYRLQIGAYRQPEHAVEVFEKLKKAGLNPAYERYGDYYRVVLAGLKQEELKTVSEKLGAAGFREVLIREE